jgi:hypothetical protein
MNLPNFKEILGKLSVLKNNTALLVPVVVTFVAIVLLVPAQLWSNRLRNRVDENSIRKNASAIKRLKADPVSDQQYQIEMERQTARAEDANEIERLAIETTERELLSYDIFPQPDPNAGFSAVIFRTFGDRYRAGIDQMIQDVNGRDCPTDEELKRSLESASTTRSRMDGMYGGMYGGADTLGMPSRPGAPKGGGLYSGGFMPMGGINSLILDQLCEARAKSLLVYVNPADIADYDYWTTFTYEGKDEAVKNCWYHQLGYWVIKDVFDTVAAMNAGHENVLTAPVKRIESISFTMGLKRPRGGGGGVFRGGRGRRSSSQNKDENTDKPTYVRTEQDGLTESCTGRYCDDNINVVHFNVAFVVNAADVMPLMDELCSGKDHRFKGYPYGRQPEQTFKHNQITILESKIGFVNPEALSHRYYRYGPGNAIELELICEYLFKKKGYESILPQPVKDTLAGKDDEKK